MFETSKWLLYIPDDGHWPLTYMGNNKREALSEARKMLQLKRLPNGAGVFRPER